MSQAVADIETLRVRVPDEVERRRTGDGHLRLIGPLLRRNGFARIMGWLLRAPERCQVELDEMGTFVIDQGNGLALATLAERLGERYKLTRREAEVALADFLKALHLRRLVLIEAAGGPGAKAPEIKAARISRIKSPRDAGNAG